MRINLKTQNAYRKLVSIKLYLIWSTGGRNANALKIVDDAARVLIHEDYHLSVDKAWNGVRAKRLEAYKAS